MKSEQVVLSLSGLSCAPCVPDIEVAVRSVEGVIWAILNYAAEELTIIFDPSAVSSISLLQVVQKLGTDTSLEGARVKEAPAEPGAA